MATTLTVTKHIAAPPETVFARASDFARAPETIRGIDRVEMLTEGPVGVGTRFRETRIMFKREASEEMEVTAFEPPRRFATDAESHGCRYHTVVTLEPKDGGTELVMSFEALPVTRAAKVMSIVMKPMIGSMRKMVSKDLDDLKAAVEGMPSE